MNHTGNKKIKISLDWLVKVWTEKEKIKKINNTRRVLKTDS